MKKIIESQGDHQVESVFHENLCGSNDKTLLSHCKKENRILITLERDFENERLHPADSHAGIIILKQKNQGKKAVSDLFSIFLRSYNLDDVKGKRVIIYPSYIQIMD